MITSYIIIDGSTRYGYTNVQKKGIEFSLAGRLIHVNLYSLMIFMYMYEFLCGSIEDTTKILNRVDIRHINFTLN
ncbi:hypothetical protein UC77_02280 [Clostridium baratii]|nr:hypothetical protein UC77_02280 [Clostridium baratii]